MKEGGCSGGRECPTGRNEERITTLPEVWRKQSTNRLLRKEQTHRKVATQSPGVLP